MSCMTDYLKRALNDHTSKDSTSQFLCLSRLHETRMRIQSALAFVSGFGIQEISKLDRKSANITNIVENHCERNRQKEEKMSNILDEISPVQYR